MRFELKLAWKYFRLRRKSLARFTAGIAIIGIACGVASLIVAQALTRGFASEMRNKILSNTAQVTVFQTSGEAIQNWEAIKNNLEKIENVREVLPTTYESALLVGSKTTAYAVLRASQNLRFEAQPAPELKAEDLKPKAEDKQIEISIGAELAEKTGLKAGDEAEIVIPTQNDFAPAASRAIIKEIFQTGLYDYDATWIRLSFEDLAKIYEKPTAAPTVLGITVKDIYAADKTAQKIREILPAAEFKVIDWQEANRPLFAALSLEKKVSLAIISLIIFIAVLNITTTLALLVSERKLDIAVLRTCGAKTGNLMLIFLIEGALLGLTGILGGLILGLAACFAANRFHLISLPADVYSLSSVPLFPVAGDIIFIILAAFLLSLAATIYPAWRAARIKPLDNLRNQ